MGAAGSGARRAFDGGFKATSQVASSPWLSGTSPPPTRAYGSLRTRLDTHAKSAARRRWRTGRGSRSLRRAAGGADRARGGRHDRGSSLPAQRGHQRRRQSSFQLAGRFRRSEDRRCCLGEQACECDEPTQDLALAVSAEGVLETFHDLPSLPGHDSDGLAPLCCQNLHQDEWANCKRNSGIRLVS